MPDRQPFKKLDIESVDRSLHVHYLFSILRKNAMSILAHIAGMTSTGIPVAKRVRAVHHLISISGLIRSN